MRHLDIKPTAGPLADQLQRAGHHVTLAVRDAGAARVEALRGKNSALVKQSEMERAVRLANWGGAEAELLVVPGAGHMLPLERPREVNEAVTAFLERTIH